MLLVNMAMMDLVVEQLAGPLCGSSSGVDNVVGVGRTRAVVHVGVLVLVSNVEGRVVIARDTRHGRSVVLVTNVGHDDERAREQFPELELNEEELLALYLSRLPRELYFRTVARATTKVEGYAPSLAQPNWRNGLRRTFATASFELARAR